MTILFRLLGILLLLALAPGAHASVQLKLADGTCMNRGAVGNSLVAGSCSGSRAAAFELPPGGVIRLADQCVQPGNSGQTAKLSACTGGDTQLWRYDSGMLRQGNLCLTAPDRSDFQQKIKLTSCASNANQYWQLLPVVNGTVQQPLSVWPPVIDKRKTVVLGGVLTAVEAQKVVQWIYNEMKIANTPWCWRGSYTRNAGTMPHCSGSQDAQSGLCYNQCRAGYVGVGPVCWQRCASGFTDTGAFCHDNRRLSYQPGYHCTARDMFGTCWASAMNSCDAGYTGDRISTCWLDKADVAKDSYGRGAGQLPASCDDGSENQAGLCYTQARANYECTGIACQESCAAGTQQCGPGACTNSARACAMGMTDMTVTTALMVADFGTAGVAGNVRLAFKAVKMGLEAGNDITQLVNTLYDSMSDYMAWSETNLASITSVDIEAAVANKYGRGSATYRLVAREWAALQMALLIGNSLQDALTLVISMIDESGLISTMLSFVKPACSQHTPFPL